MKRWMLIGLVLLCSLLPGGPARAEELTEAKRAAIRELMHLTGADQMELHLGAYLSQQLFEMVYASSPKVPDEVYEITNQEVRQLVSERLPDMLGEMVPIYHRYFTHEEIKALIAFYRTDLGQKTLTALPKLIDDSRQLGQDWGERLGIELVQRVDRRLAKEGIQLEGH